MRQLLIKIVLLLALSFSVSSQAYAQADTRELDPENSLYLFIKAGLVIIKLRPDLAPRHVDRIKTLTREKFYDGLFFHRVIDGFMAQTGDPQGNGTGGSPYPNLEAEFSKTPFKRGVLGMARGQSLNSANSQFFIMFADGRWLNEKYTVVGEVVEGMRYIDQIKKGEQALNGAIAGQPDTIHQLYVMADFLKEEAKFVAEIERKKKERADEEAKLNSDL